MASKMSAASPAAGYQVASKFSDSSCYPQYTASLKCPDLLDPIVLIEQGFEVIELIVDVQHCLQAYVGVAKNLNAIIIAFRGTQELRLELGVGGASPYCSESEWQNEAVEGAFC